MITDTSTFFRPLSRSYRKQPPDTITGEKDSPIVTIPGVFFAFACLIHQFRSNEADFGRDRQYTRMISGLQGYQPAGKADGLNFER